MTDSIEILNSRLALRQAEIKYQAHTSGWSAARTQHALDEDHACDQIRSEIAEQKPDSALEKNLIRAQIALAEVELSAGWQADGCNPTEIAAMIEEDTEIRQLKAALAKLI